MASCEEKGLTLIPPQPAASPIVMTTDSLRLTQILINLVSNAIKYTEQGSVSLKIDLDADAQQIRIAVVDTGIGIKAEDCSRLFQRFEQCDDSSRYKIGHGTGLGLAIVDNLAHLLGGMVDVESELGKGSSFTLVLPFVVH
jgi:signal transduction histidine kinase